MIDRYCIRSNPLRLRNALLHDWQPGHFRHSGGRASMGAVGALVALILFALPLQVASAQSAGPPPSETLQTLADPASSEAETLSTPDSALRSIFLPFVQMQTPVLPLEGVAVLDEPYPCGDQVCYDIQVQCSQLVQPIAATLRVGEPASPTTLGTIVFFSGYTGTTFWEGWGQGLRVLTELRAAGYRTIQVRWAANWYLAAPNEVAGLRRLACRGATVTQWIVDTWRQPDQELPFCVYGHSNGATAASFLLEWYGVSTALSAIMLDAGPNHSRLDAGCLQDDPELSALWYTPTQANVVDGMFGYPPDGTGPCSRQDATFRPQFEDNSVALRLVQRLFHVTTVHFVFGELDLTATRAHGEQFYQTLAGFQLPYLARDVVAGAGHVTVDTTEGADLIRDGLLADCRLR